MSALRSVVTLLALLVWLTLLAVGAGPLPALGPMLALNGGVWDHQRVEIPDTVLKELKEPVTVTLDRHGVPHIFAAQEADLYLVQGYLMASQRLFQMDLMTRITDGRLSEWFGSRTRKTDDFFVRFGMRESARRTLKKFSENPQTLLLLESFVKGVNAYIDGLKDLPPEYKILNRKPEPFSLMRIMHMDKQLTFGLAGRSFDTYLSRIQQQLGTEKVLDLFPLFDSPDLDDFIVSGNGKKRLPPERPEDFPFTSSLKLVPHFPLPAAGNGSNNWAVSAKRSATGFSILANDTHLSQTLPNIWWETQLHTPQFNVYGVALVAVPGIINGFNGDIAWGPTNGTLDALDYYEIEFENENSFRYRNGGQWATADVQRETVNVRRDAGFTVDVVWTKYGVVLHREGRRGLAAKWAGHQTENELNAVRGLFAAKTLDECLKSFETWAVPVQNFICADRRDVSIQHTGFLPKRRIGEGRFIMPAADDEPLGRAIAEADRPRIVRPKEGFVLSANQRVTDPAYPHYMGWDFEDPFRGIMIRRRLSEKEKYTPEDMMRIQNDAYELPAEKALPLMLRALKDAPEDADLARLVLELKSWDYFDRPDSRPAAVFRAWFETFSEAVFADEYKVQTASFRPKDPRFIQLLRRVLQDPADSDSQWVDNKDTKDKVESLAEVAASSLHMARIKMQDRMGADIERWNFKNWIRTRVEHAARFPGFGSEILEMAGSADSIRGNAGQHGAVYKAVIALGDEPKAWMQVPGGNEGDPFSPDYGKFVTEWAAGTMREVEYYKNREEAESRAVRVIRFTPPGRGN